MVKMSNIVREMVSTLWVLEHEWTYFRNSPIKVNWENFDNDYKNKFHQSIIEFKQSIKTIYLSEQFLSMIFRPEKLECHTCCNFNLAGKSDTLACKVLTYALNSAPDVAIWCNLEWL